MRKILGVVLIDIGGSNTSITIFSEASIKHTAILPVGGNYLTSDISTGLTPLPLGEAEKIKIKYGCAMTSMIPKDETIRVPSLGAEKTAKVSRQILGRIVEPRVEEILNLAYNEKLSVSVLKIYSPLELFLTGGNVAFARYQ